MKFPANAVKVGFICVCVTSPTLGAFLSDVFSKKFIGDDERRVVPFLLVVTMLATSCALPLPLASNFFVIISCLWGYLFFGGILVPIMTTYMLGSIEEKDRAIANSFANVLYYFFGYLPSPKIWGLVQEATGGNTSRYGLVANLAMNIPPIFFLIIAFKFRKPKAKVDREFIDISPIGKKSFMKQL